MPARLLKALPGPAIAIRAAGNLSPERYRNTLYRFLHGKLTVPASDVFLVDLISQLFDRALHPPSNNSLGNRGGNSSSQ